MKENCPLTQYFKGYKKPITDPEEFKMLCAEGGSLKLFNIIDTPEMISLTAKEIDAQKHELSELKSAFEPYRKENFTYKNVDLLKIKAAEFLTKKFLTGILRNGILK